MEVNTWIPSWMVLSHTDQRYDSTALKCFVNTCAIQVWCTALRSGLSFTFSPLIPLLASALQQQRCLQLSCSQLSQFYKACSAGDFLVEAQVCFLDVASVKLQQCTRRTSQADTTVRFGIAAGRGICEPGVKELGCVTAQT